MQNPFNPLAFRPLALLLCVCWLQVAACSQTPPEEPPVTPADPIPTPVTGPGPTAFAVNDTLGAGFNLGNVFDNGINEINLNELKAIIRLYKGAGMTHVRIPVTWTEPVGGSVLYTAAGGINTGNSRFQALKDLIDYTLNQDLYVVLNAHHERDFKEHYDGSESARAEIFGLWRAIATQFQAYSYRLVFEILNEPDGAFGDWDGNGPDPFNAQALAFTREMYAEGVRAVRESGEINQTRVVMISTNGMGNHSMIDEVYPDRASLPGGGNDAYLMIQVHTYDPWAFCGQDGDNVAYPGDASVRNQMLAAIAHGVLLEVPLNYGEFGVGRANNQASRDTDIVRGYYHTVVSTCRANGVSSSVWDDRGWFGLIRDTGGNNFEFLYNIVPTMLVE